ncbi:hypothetical protein CHS0354_002527, partial [Potamilus streckersoni]
MTSRNRKGKANVNTNNITLKQKYSIHSTQNVGPSEQISPIVMTDIEKAIQDSNSRIQSQIIIVIKDHVTTPKGKHPLRGAPKIKRSVPTTKQPPTNKTTEPLSKTRKPTNIEHKTSENEYKTGDRKNILVYIR